MKKETKTKMFFVGHFFLHVSFNFPNALFE